MPITALAIDQCYGMQDYRITLDVFAARNQQTEAARVALTMHNQTARFSERLVERLLLEQEFAGEISGTITEAGVPVARLVRIYRRSDGQFVGETTSDAATGDYTVAGMRPGVEYFALAFDAEGEPDFNAMALDRIVP